MPRKPWLTPGLAKSCHRKEKLYKCFINNPTASNKLNYVKYRNKLNTLLRKAEQAFYKDKFELYKCNIKQTWKTIKLVLNSHNSPLNDTFIINNKSTTDKSVIANKFNEYFVNIGPSLANKIHSDTSDIPYLSYMKGDFKNSFGLLETDALEIISVAKDLKAKSSAGYDDIPSDIMKLSINFTASILSKIINKSFSEGQVPALLKVAKVCPVYKNGDKSTISNYRPISVLPSFSKIFEKIVYNRLTGYLNKHCVLTSNQFGFRNNYSTAMAVLEMVDKISDAIDNKCYSIGVFVDLSKAFDTLDHDILLGKLAYYGIRGTALSWFKSYFQNRLQYVAYNGYNSPRSPITCGVPQGSILGPLLFLLYINDIVNVSNVLQLILFADDTNLFAFHKDLNTLVNLVNNELKCLNSWFKVNKLSLNVDKTVFMVFTSARKKYDVNAVTSKIKFDNKPILQVSTTKFLGVHINEHLSWVNHINQVENKISKTCGILAKLKYYLPQTVLLKIYNALLLPYLQYCAIIWGSSSHNVLNNILIIQKRAVRNICMRDVRAHSAPLFKKLSILKITDIYTQQVSNFMYKYNRNLLPINFENYFAKNSTVHHHNTRSADNFHLSFSHTTLRLNCIKNAGPRIWNSLSNDLKSSCSLHVFNRKIKSLLTQNYL